MPLADHMAILELDKVVYEDINLYAQVLQRLSEAHGVHVLRTSIDTFFIRNTVALKAVSYKFKAVQRGLKTLPLYRVEYEMDGDELKTLTLKELV